jgi:transglutaminase-like putative cysteine protease
MLAMWTFFPRIATPFWAVPIDTSSATSGLSDSMSPGDISSLSLSNEVAFRVRFENEMPPPQQRYWRGLVLYRFNGRTWSGREPGRMPRVRDNILVSGEPVNYEVTLEPTRQHYVFALDIPMDWSLERTSMGPQQQLTRIQPIDQRVAYKATSYPSYQIQPNMSLSGRQWYTSVPEGSNPRSADLARGMRDATGSDEEFIRSVLAMFHDEEFFYTLEPPALGSNPVDRFLFETRQGFCEHYASAFSVMMRAAGIPSRIVLGYQGGEVNPLGRYLIVRQADAHAWTEVWLDGKGWSRIDPTAAVAPERIDIGRSGAMFGGIGASWGLNAPPEWLHSLSLTWDALNARWNDWVLGYGPENQELFMRWLGMDDPDWQKMMLTLLVFVVAIIAAISFALILRYKPPPQDPAVILYRKFTRKAGIAPRRGETPQSYALRLRQDGVNNEANIARVTNSYLAVRYGPPNPHALANLQGAVKNFATS